MSSKQQLHPQLPLSISLRPGASLSNFQTGEVNGLVLDLLAQFAMNAKERQVFLWGGNGSGKTHLLNAVCNMAGAQHRRAVYIPLQALSHYGVGLLQGLESLDIVCIDDLQTIANDRDWQVAIFNLINRSRDAGKQLLFAADDNPLQGGYTLPDLVSRFTWGPVLRVAPLDDDSLRAALIQRAAEMGFELSEEVATYMQNHYVRDIVTVTRYLEQLDRASLAAQRRLTIPFVKSVLARDK